ncbi:P-loop containing nucleoside triphosphate hydrolase protein [Rhexocercosporidium sp. MPI-PUGE-AT-0058]|nr:P-loop containing nucleoside triphosphate hydrolase protein [Rhexocercosporidium sp. MPI-PUGE-AT-0058]
MQTQTSTPPTSTTTNRQLIYQSMGRAIACGRTTIFSARINMIAIQEEPSGAIDSNRMMELVPTTLDEISAEQILSLSPDLEICLPNCATTTERDPDTEMSTCQDFFSIEEGPYQKAYSEKSASHDNRLGDKIHDQQTNVEMVNCQDNTAKQIEFLEPEVTEIDAYQEINLVGSTPGQAADCTVKISQESTNMEQQLENMEDFKPINSGNVCSVKQESTYQENTTIKKELDYTRNVHCQDVKQEYEECKTSLLEDGPQHWAQFQSVRYAEPEGALEFRSSRDLRTSAREIKHDNIELGEELPDPAPSCKRKKPHEEPKSRRELCEKLKGPSEHLKPDLKTTYHIPKRQKPTPTAQNAQESKLQAALEAKNVGANSRGDSARQLSHKNNLLGGTTALMSLLIGSNQTDAFPPGNLQEETPKFKAVGWSQQFRNMLANCPKTSDAKDNRSDLASLNTAVKNFGRKMKAENGLWMLNGMISGLLNHQVIGVDWMIGREQSTDECQGGILADSMGLGKTVQTLATMVANPPEKKTRKKDQRSTLIIAAPSILAQWASEVDKHTVGRVFRGITIFDAKREQSAQRLTDNDIVFASYGEVIRSCQFPSREHESKLKGVNRDSAKGFEAAEDDSAAVEGWIQQNIGRCGGLHQVDWYRIVIDEAYEHKMKNHEARFSYAVNALKGKHRWALSGVPSQVLQRQQGNDILDDLALGLAINYVQIPENMERLDNTLARLLISRTMQDKFMGSPLVNLPRPHHKDSKLDFSPQEKILYEAVEGRFIKEINETPEDQNEGTGLGDVGHQREEEGESDEDVAGENKPEKQDENMKDMLIGLMRLRQLENFDIRELEEIYQKLLDLNDPNNLICRRIGVLLQQKKRGFKQYDSPPRGGDVCRICYDIATDTQIIPLCKHCFCKACINEHANVEVSRGKDEPECPVCGSSFDTTALKEPAQLRKSKKTGLSISSTENNPNKKPDEESKKTPSKKSKKKAKKEGMDYLGLLPTAPRMPWLDDFDSGVSEMPPSTKLNALEKQIKEWIITAPSDKIIIFTQWRAFTAIIGRVLERENINFVYFTGDMTVKIRQDAISQFRSNPSIKAMVATLKTAGEGLNLEFANRVVSTDLWWNACAERQAFARVYRIGQTKETHFTRLIVANSVDDRILEMQTQKLQMVDHVMQPKLSRLEMAKLIGRARTDKNGRIRVEATSGKKIEEDDFIESDSEEAEDETYTKMGDSDSDDSGTDEY